MKKMASNTVLVPPRLANFGIVQNASMLTEEIGIGLIKSPIKKSLRRPAAHGVQNHIQATP